MVKTDLQLVEEAKSGKAQSFAELVSRHQKGLLRVILRLTRDLETAEDVVQDSFLKAFRKLDSYEGRASFRSWLYQIGLNTAKNKMRTWGRVNIDCETVILAEGPKAETGLMVAHLRALVRFEIDQLPPKQRVALTLRIFEDLSFKQIAEIMACPYDTAKANYRHAIMKLRHRFNEESVINGDGMENLTGGREEPMMEVDA